MPAQSTSNSNRSMSIRKKMGNTNGDTGGGGNLEESETSGNKHYERL
jgi:hypothetical protein